MNLREFKASYRERLKDNYTEREADHLFFIFLEEWGELSLSAYLTAQLDTPESELAEKMMEALTKLQEGKPYQHILGYTWFHGVRLKVNEHTLVPRPETEEMAELIREKTHAKDFKKILDVGTGSACLALGVASSFPDAHVLGIDISKEAINVACENASANQIRADFKEVNFLDPEQRPEGNWDLIVSNPPYIAQHESETMDDLVVKNEPHEALFVQDDDPLIFYSVLADYGQHHLNKGGMMFLEINERLGSETLSIFTALDFKAELLRDLSGKDRFVVISR